MSFNAKLKQVQNYQQLQHLIMTPQMQQALQLMQLPILELSLMIQEEIENNPLLEYSEDEDPVDEENEESNSVKSQDTDKELFFDDKDFEILKKLDEDFDHHFSDSENAYTRRTAEEEKRKTFLEQSIPSRKSLFDHLMQQAKETFSLDEDVVMAEAIIGNFDENGFLATPLKEVALLGNFDLFKLKTILKEIQTFEPHGVGATSLREALLIQLRCRGQEKTLGYTIIENYYEDLLQNNILKIQKGLRQPLKQIQEAIDSQITVLDLHPGTLYFHHVIQPIIPDVTLIQNDQNNLTVVVNDTDLPALRINSRYLRMLDDDNLSKETKDFIRHKLLSAKWLFKNIDQRNTTLYRISALLAKRQKNFFIDPRGQLVPLTMRDVANALEVHESTVTRVVANKYMDCPRGLMPLRYFFSTPYTTSEGRKVSSKAVREFLKEFLSGENKRKPLSDETLSQLLKAKGIRCARRTIAKYRAEMGIGNVKQRRRY